MKNAICVASTILLLLYTPAEAAVADDFQPLLTELSARSLSLSNSTDKLAKKEKAAAALAIKTINRSTNSLKNGITAACTVGTSLSRAFTNDFSTGGMGRATNLEDLVIGVFTNLGSEVQMEISSLSSMVSGLPAGKTKTKAQGLLTKAQNSLATITSATSFAKWASALKSALASAVAGEAIASKGGGGSAGLQATVTINGVSQPWVATTTEAEWVKNINGGILDIRGSRGNPVDSQMSVPVPSGFTGATGTYSLVAGSYTVSSPFKLYFITSGTLNITSFNEAAKTLTATFSFTAADGGDTVTVSNGSANITNVSITP